MRYSRVLRTALLAFTIPAAGCTNYGETPTGPTITTLSPQLEAVRNPPPQVSGLYSGDSTLTGISGGAGALRDAGGNECVANAFATAVANANDSNDMSLLITQDKTDNTIITARATSRETGLACTYKGAIGSSNGLILDADPASCTGATLLIRCLPDPITGVVLVREMRLVGASVSATFDGWPANVTAIRGQAAVTYNLHDIDQQRTPVGGFVANQTFVVSRQ